MIASVGLDKKLYTFDRGSRRPSFCIPYEMPFSSLAFRDDGWTLAAGTSHGQVVFYDVRGKPQPFSILCAYGNSEVNSSCSIFVINQGFPKFEDFSLSLGLLIICHLLAYSI